MFCSELQLCCSVHNKELGFKYSCWVKITATLIEMFLMFRNQSSAATPKLEFVCRYKTGDTFFS